MVQQLHWEGELAIEKLARLLALLEDRPALATLIVQSVRLMPCVRKCCENPSHQHQLPIDKAEALADRLASYIKERLNGDI